MSEADTDGQMAAFLKDHPRAMGILFAMLVALTQVQGAMAGGGATGIGSP